VSEAVVGRSATVKTKHRGLDIATDGAAISWGSSEERKRKRSEKMEEMVDGRDEMSMPSCHFRRMVESGSGEDDRSATVVAVDFWIARSWQGTRATAGMQSV
jgi:hypothetical protein